MSWSKVGIFALGTLFGLEGIKILSSSLKYEKIIDGMKCHTIEEITSALESAGFSKVVSDHHDSKPWITVVATK